MSFAKTLPINSEVVQLIFVYVLLTATIAGVVTIIVTVAGSQFASGFNFSHKLYTIVYVPAGVPAGTETCPVNGSKIGTGFPFIGVAGVVTVIVT